ncbi:MAG TPA: bifunctional 5,10-methylenetetrahydrofolate dehydrogenase/5,10-methenyltetrahydrofolate cyclohydrolase [Candidatus Saccharimonadales bacterium]|jgi:methylenetetrahydrofolate dehydrogenase (NADP+)/methenyltetrahydrofolate cyclohydrolase
MKLLYGSELAGFIKERQARDVRSLGFKVKPKLAIIVTIDHPVINVYIRLKQGYGEDIGVDVDVYRIKQAEVKAKLSELNKDKSVHGIIIQLPIEDPRETTELVNLVDPNKDVDALGAKAKFEPATPMAIMWLLAGYNINLSGKEVLLIGKGKLVGEPLERILKASDIDVKVADRSTKDLAEETLEADVIITATGSPAILYPSMIKEGAVVVDAGVASEDGKTVGDVDDSLYERDDLTLTPKKGGVGPLTVCALFENVIIAAKQA